MNKRSKIELNLEFNVLEEKNQLNIDAFGRELSIKINIAGIFSDKINLRNVYNELRFLIAYFPFLDLVKLKNCLYSYLFSIKSLENNHSFTVEKIEGTFSLIDKNGEVLEEKWKESKSKAHLKIEKNIFGYVEIVYENQEAGLYRLFIEPKNKIPNHYHKIMLETEYMLTNKIHLQGKPMKQGDIVSWEHGKEHQYENFSSKYQVILCIDKPAFIPGDEIIVKNKG